MALQRIRKTLWASLLLSFLLIGLAASGYA
jgi:hypothetical protein